ncbi:MAG: phage tail sheath family protein [Deltaproteobacteria bacterium]|nr:phage tail sheath family protein [Deltaproteobacteria bacterium]MCW5805588.1 phage tail sheath family protein [Deltaproteobacteria bacterium]
MRMRPSADPRAPGVYQSFDSVAPPPLSIANTRIAGFVGITQKGPMNEPTRLASFDEFLEIFGSSDVTYTTDAVRGFFRNGGTDCWVVRIAHCAPNGERPELEHASCAEHVQIDDWNKPALKIHSLNEGSWGNMIWFRCVHAPGAETLLSMDLDIGSGEAHVKATRGFEVGSLVKIYDRENADYIVITEVDEKEKVIRWSTETPVNRRHRSSAPTYLQVLTFEIHVAMKDRREVFKNLQMHPSSRNYAPRVVSQRSRLVRLEDLKTKSPVPHNLPEQLPMTRLTGGRDGIEVLKDGQSFVAVTPEDFIGHNYGPGDRSGLSALAANEEIALLAAPDAMWLYEREPGPSGERKAQRVQDEMISICENQRDRFAILDIPQRPPRSEQEHLVDWVRRWRRRTDSTYCAYYWPWFRAVHEGTARVVPPSGYLAGCYARADVEEGVHRAPANQHIEGVEDVSLRITEDHIGILNADAVNTFRIQRGVRAWGARTASSDPEWRYIPIRRLFIMLRRSLEAGFAWITFEPNNQTTWDLVARRTTEFLSNLYTKGMLAGGNPEQAFFVKCDAETNQADQVDAGLLICDIGVAPVSPAEFIMISLTQTMGTPITA